MKIIDKLIIIVMGLFICTQLNLENKDLLAVGLFPIFYAVFYLIIVGLESEDFQ